MSQDGELCREAASIIQERGLAMGRTQDENGSVCLIGALNVATTGNSREMTSPAFIGRVGKTLVALGVAPRGRYWNPFLGDAEEGIHFAGVDEDDWPAGWSNACAWRGDPDAVIHGLKLAGEGFDLLDDE